jgi:hypothetical protein
MATVPSATASTRPMSGEERKVILASSLGTVFEWYDFYLYGSLAVVIGAKFFSMYDETTRNIFALLAFAAGFLVRPLGRWCSAASATWSGGSTPSSSPS